MHRKKNNIAVNVDKVLHRIYISKPAYQEQLRREYSYAKASRCHAETPNQSQPQSHHGTSLTHHIHLSPTPRKSDRILGTSASTYLYLRILLISERYKYVIQ